MSILAAAGSASVMRAQPAAAVTPAASPHDSGGTGGPQLTAPSTAVSFGDARVGDIAGPLDVTLTNTGGSDDTVTSASYAGPDVNDFLISTTCTDVTPGGTCTLEVYFLPGALGLRQSAITLVDGTSTPLVLTFDGTGTEGYYEVTSTGVVHPFGDATFYGSTGTAHLSKPIVGTAVTPDGGGYWLAASDGGIFAFGDAGFFGSTGAVHLNKPIVGMAVTPDGLGYWLVASDGGIFAYGDAGFYGSTGAIRLNKPIVGMAPVPDGHGYWLVASDGGIFAYGDAPFDGSTAVGQASSVIGLVGTAPPTLQAIFDFPA